MHAAKSYAVLHHNQNVMQHARIFSDLEILLRIFPVNVMIDLHIERHWFGLSLEEEISEVGLLS